MAASCEKKSIGISLNEYTGSISSVAGKTVTVTLFEGDSLAVFVSPSITGFKFNFVFYRVDDREFATQECDKMWEV